MTAAEIWRSTVPVWLGLMALLLATLTLAFVPMGAFNTVASIGIASVKTLLVALFFMHLRLPVPLHRMAAAAGLLWLFFMFTLTLADVLTR